MMKTILLLFITCLALSGCMTKAGVRNTTTKTTYQDGRVEEIVDCQADYMNFKDSTTTGVSGCGAGGQSDGATSNTVLMELLMRGLQAQN